MALLNSKPGVSPLKRRSSRSEFLPPFIQSPVTVRQAVPPFITGGKRSLRSIFATLKKNADTSKEEGVDGGAITASSSTENSSAPVRIVALVGEGSISPMKSTPWFDVMIHTVSKFLSLMFRILSSIMFHLCGQ